VKGRTLLSLVVAALFGLVAFLLVQFSDGGKVGIPKAEACTEASAMRCLPNVTFKDTSGKTYSKDALNGKVVIVNFWATWCHPCQGEIPDLAEVYAKYKDRGVVLLGVLTDDVDDGQLAAFSQRFGLNYPVVRVDDQIRSIFGSPDALPTTFIYDRTGHLQYGRPGAMNGSDLEAILGRLVE
jgi:thiol-disulfide isomerase/thioredoxin